MKRDRRRNFAIIAHINHGKSTLVDRLYELSGEKKQRNERGGFIGEQTQQILDTNPIERERGITIKLAPLTLKIKSQGEDWLFNLIDTPGHVDFNYEVSRSLAAGEGAVLLIDANSGVQAQTLAHMTEAVNLGLMIVPVVNKIDLADKREINKTKREIASVLGTDAAEVMEISAKTGRGVEALVNKIAALIPPPKVSGGHKLQALVFNSTYDTYQGVVAYVRIMTGEVRVGDEVVLLGSGTKFGVQEVGVFKPERTRTVSLAAGDIGYVITGVKDPKKCRSGDTISRVIDRGTALAGYRPPQPMVFVTMFPVKADKYGGLSKALAKLNLTDTAFSFTPISSASLGFGFRCGFLGPLHAEVTQERLEREYGQELLITSPQVSYRIEKTNEEKMTVSDPAEFPETSQIKQTFEPVVAGEILTPQRYLNQVLRVLQNSRTIVGEVIPLAEWQKDQIGQLVVKAVIPFSELVKGLFETLKEVSSGFASLHYEPAGYQPIKVVKLTILINKQPVAELSRLVMASQAQKIGTELVNELKKVIPRQQFEVAIQAAIGAKIVARATQKPFRKDVTAKLYGGDQTRKDKLLKKQKKGKRRMKLVGRVELPQEAFRVKAN